MPSTGQGALARSATGGKHLGHRSCARTGTGGSHFAHLLSMAQADSSCHESKPSRTPALSVSPSTSGPDSPGHAGSPISSKCKPRFCSLPVSPAPVIMWCLSFVRSWGFWGCFLVGMMRNFLDRVAARCGVFLKNPLSLLFSRKWSRHRRKRIRGSGSQAASHRGAKCHRLALVFKAPSDSFLTRGTRWLRVLIATSIYNVYGQAKIRALRLATCTTFFISSALTCVPKKYRFPVIQAGFAFLGCVFLVAAMICAFSVRVLMSGLVHQDRLRPWRRRLYSARGSGVRAAGVFSFSVLGCLVMVSPSPLPQAHLACPGSCEHHTSHAVFSHRFTRTCVAQVVCLSCAHHVSCVIHDVVVLTLFDYSTFLSLLIIFSLIILSFLLHINFIFQDVVDKFPVHFRK